jgi:uncharacterized membrane protein YkvA (DUF1232 family)
MQSTLKHRLHLLKREAYALYIAARDPRVPWYARLFLALVLAHTFSPIDLIPDFIPVLGYLDDLIITPLGIALALKMIPAHVMADAREQAEELMRQGVPASRVGALLVVLAWLLVLAALLWSLARALGGG